MSNLPEKQPLLDQEQRTTAIHNLDTTLLVEAAAGTGKTTLLVERIVSIVRTKQISLSRVAAITFTEKAAGELKIKLRKRFEQLSKEDSAHREMYLNVLRELDLMPVGTIHGFCRDLIMQRPVEAGVDPHSQVADQLTADLLAEEVWESWISEELSRDCEFLRPLFERGLKLESEMSEFSLHKLYRLLLDKSDRLDEFCIAALSSADFELAMQAFFAQTRESLDALLTGCLNEDDLFAHQLIQVRLWKEHGRTLSDPEAIFDWLGLCPQINLRAGKQSNWSSKEALDTAKAWRPELQSGIARLRSVILSIWSAPLLTWLKDSVRKYNETKEQRGLLDFQDLLVLTRDMLQRDTDARKYFKERFDYLLVDEFQDTDPLQAEIVFFLAETKDKLAKQWEDVQLIPGKLFIVGDPKQSIYRFRHADLDLYGKVKRLIMQQGQSLAICMNFRSLPPIIHEVNLLFNPLMKGDVNGRYEPLYEKMEPYRTERSDLSSVVFLPPPVGFVDQDTRVVESASTEAAFIAQYIRDLVASKIPFEANGIQRTISYCDIGILFRQMTRLRELETALHAYDIPYQIFGGKEFVLRNEIQALKAVVAALDNPFDSASVVGALRFPFFGCTDEELLSHRLQEGSFNYLNGQSAEAHLHTCFSVLSELHESKTRCTPSETLHTLYEKTAGLQVYTLKPLGENRLANLLKVLDIAKSLERSKSYSFHELSRWLLQLEELSISEEDSPVIESGDNFVQLMTFHKAKGLEFPVAILYRLGQKFKERYDPIAATDTHEIDFRATLNNGTTSTQGFDQAQALEREKESGENLRLLYVAMTRAKEQLVLPAFWSAKPEGLYAILTERYPQRENGHPDISRCSFQIHDVSTYQTTCESKEEFRLDLSKPISESVQAESSLRRESWRKQKADLIQQLDHRSLFATASHRPGSEAQPPAAQDRQPERANAEDAAQFGTYVHRVMEQISLPAGEDLEQVLKSVAIELEMDNEENMTVARLIVKRALSANLFKTRLAKAEEIYRELNFTAELDGVLYEGKMDLVFVENGKPVIVDFKTDSVTAQQAALRAENHRPQAEIYARAMQQITGKKPESLLFFLRPGVEVMINDK